MNRHILALVLSLAVSHVAFADSIPGLTRFLEDEIVSADTSVSLLPAAPASSFDEEWYYRRFWLRVRVPVGIEVPWIVKVLVVPEVELLWQRDYPDGWGGYKP